MTRTMLAVSLVAAGLLLAGVSQQAAAGISAPALAPATDASAVKKVVWVCGPVQCVWDPTPDAGYVVLLGLAELDACAGSVEALAAAIRRAAAAAGLPYST